MEFVGSGSAATAASLRSASNGIVMQCAGRFNGRAATTPSSGAPQRTRSVKIVAKIKKGKMGPEEEYPWPDKFPPGEITDGALKYLNRFKPMPNPTKPVTLPFERPIADLENKIDEVSASPLSLTNSCFVFHVLAIGRCWNRILGT
jgi:acetyl-CoA carboxylase carboxyl transferase subunit alpha